MRRRLHFLTIRNSSSETETMLFGKAPEETKDHPRTEIKLAQGSLLDIHLLLNIDKHQGENPSSMTTMGITTSVNLLWENYRHQILEISRGAFTRALNWKTLPSTHQWFTTCLSSQELKENLRQLISNAYMSFAKI
ncbi:unnamed protein product [Rhodiola kirilowii]